MRYSGAVDLGGDMEDCKISLDNLASLINASNMCGFCRLKPYSCRCTNPKKCKEEIKNSIKYMDFSSFGIAIKEQT